MTKKIISILLSVLMIFSAMPVGVFAGADVELNLGTAQIDGANVKVPVTLSALPDGFDSLSSLAMSYVYDKDVLTYAGVEGAALALESGHYSDGRISWYNSNSTVTSVDDTVMFYLLFTAASDDAAEVEITSAELATNVNGYKYYVPKVNKIIINAPVGKLDFEATVVDNTVEVAAKLDIMPGDIADIASATISYTYDKNVLTYKNTVAGVLDVDAGTAADGKVSWYSSSNPVTDIDNSVLFTLVFDIASDAESTTITPSAAEIVSSAYVVSKNIEIDGAVVEFAPVVTENAKLGFGGAAINDNEITVPVVMDKIPEDIDAIASFTMEYSYDADKLEYAGTISGVLDVEEGSSANDGTVSWYAKGADVTDVTDALVMLKFIIKDDAEGNATITIDTVEITDHNNVSELVETQNKTIALPEYNVPSVVSFGPAVIEDTTVKVPVKLDKIPDECVNISSFTMEYEYSDYLLTYVGVEAGAIPVDSATSTDGKVSWYSSTAPVTDVTDVLFTLIFEVKAGESDTAHVGSDYVEIGDNAGHVTQTINIEETNFDVIGSTEEPVVTGITTDITELTIPVNTPDAEKYIKENIKVYAVYSDGEKEEITNYTLNVDGTDINITYGSFAADVALTYEKATVAAGSAEVTGTERTFRIPVTMTGIPADIANVAAVTIEYTYDDAVEYAGTEAGVISVDDATAADGKVSWFSSTAPVTEIEDSVLFTLVFKAPCDAEAEFDLAITAEIADSAHKITENVNTVNGTVKVEAVEHDWSEWETTVAPTLDANGKQTRVCANCGETEVQDIVMTGIELSKDTLDVPYRQQSADKKMPYIKSQVAVSAQFSDGTVIIITDAYFADQGDIVKITYNGFEKTLALNLEAQPDKDEVYFDIPVAEENREIKVPIVISGVPDSIEAVESIEIVYTFDDTLLEYTGTNNPGDDNLNTDGSETGKAVIDADVEIETDDIDHTTKAILVFKAPCKAQGEVVVTITNVIINGTDVSDMFNLEDIVVNVVPQDCVFGEWENHPDTDPKDYKNGMQIRYCVNCGIEFETRKLEVSYIEHAQTKITVPYKQHKNKTEEEIAQYLAANAGTLATATLANGEKVGLDNADITVAVDSTVPKAIITYANAYNEATGEYYDARCEIALEYKPSTSSSSSGGGSSRPGNTGGVGNITIVPSTPSTPSTPDSEFKDLPETHFAYDAIKDLYDRGIISGDGNGNINPNVGITREETAKVALLINGIEVESGLPIDFDDKAQVSDWAYDYVATAIKHGILKGYGDGTVRPGDIVSREEMVAIIIRALNVQINGEAETKYSDVSSDKWSVGYIAAASDLGLVTGYPDGTFKPDADITRAEAFTIYHRVLTFKETLAAAIQ